MTKERLPQHSMSRSSSRQATERPGGATRTPPQALSSPTSSHPSVSTSANVRPLFSFANAAGAKVPLVNNQNKRVGEEESVVDGAAEQVADLSVA